MSEESTELPEGWETSTIGEIADYVQRGKSPKYTDWSELPVVNQKSVRWHEIDPKHLKFIHPDQWTQWGEERFLQKGDILWNSTGTGTIGRAAIFTGLARYSRSVADSHVTVVRAKTYNSKLLHFWIMSPVIQGKIASMHVGSTNQVELSRSEVLKTKVPLPPLNEQRRIVAKIEALRARSQRAKEALEAIPLLLDQFRQSVLAAAFRGDLTADWREQNPDVEPASVLLERIQEERIKAQANEKRRFPKRPDTNSPDNFENPEDWQLVLSHDLFLFVTSGSRGWAQYYSDDGAIFIRVGNLNRQTISLDLESIQRVSPPLGTEGTRTRIQPGDILISITADIGMIGVVPENTPEAYINQHVALARPFTSFSKEYVSWYLASSEGGFKQLQQLQRGATKIGLGLDDIRNVWIPFPSIEEQKEIVRRIGLFFNTAEKIEQQYQKTKAYIDKLDQSILAKAFRGELVPQDSKDEPASILLERIRAERAKREAEAKAAKTKGNRGRRRAESRVDQFEQINLPGLE